MARSSISCLVERGVAVDVAGHVALVHEAEDGPDPGLELLARLELEDLEGAPLHGPLVDLLVELGHLLGHVELVDELVVVLGVALLLDASRGIHSKL